MTTWTLFLSVLFHPLIIVLTVFLALAAVGTLRRGGHSPRKRRLLQVGLGLCAVYAFLLLVYLLFLLAAPGALG